jgi:teichuronic acid biosynthesis glycosyltransferase TuaH
MAAVSARGDRAARRPGLLIAANPVVAATWRSRGLDPKLIPFGTDSDAYAGVENAPRPPEVSLPGPVAGFIGRINARVDLRLLEVIAARGRSLLLVGPKDPAFEPERFEALRRRPNVYWAGLKPATALPGYLRMMDIARRPWLVAEAALELG